MGSAGELRSVSRWLTQTEALLPVSTGWGIIGPRTIVVRPFCFSPLCHAVIVTGMKVRGRSVAMGAVLVGTVVIGWARFACEEKVLEQWYLWKLESAEEEERELAAKKLGEMRSRRAIPQLIEILRHAPKRGAVHLVWWSLDGRRLASTRVWDLATPSKKPPEDSSTVELPVSWPRGRLLRIDPTDKLATGKPISASTVRVWDTATGKPISGYVRSHYSFNALVRIGRPAVSALLRLLEDTDEGNRLAAAAALNEIDPQEHEEVPVLRDTLEVDSVTR